MLIKTNLFSISIFGCAETTKGWAETTNAVRVVGQNIWLGRNDFGPKRPDPLVSGRTWVQVHGHIFTLCYINPFPNGPALARVFALPDSAALLRVYGLPDSAAFIRLFALPHIAAFLRVSFSTSIFKCIFC